MTELDIEAYFGIQECYGSLAADWVSAEYTEWTPEAVEDALLRLYLNRHRLIGVTDASERLRIARDAFRGDGGQLGPAKVARLETRLRQLTA